MKRLSLVASLVVLFTLSVYAADPPKPQLFLIHEETAMPSMITQYEASTKDLIKAFADKKMTSSSFMVNTYMTNDFHYLYMTPIANWAQIDSVYKDWMTADATVGKERWADIMKRGGAAMVSYDDAVAARRDDLSYQPENPRLKMEEMPYARVDYYYLKPGAEAAAEQVAKDYVALFKEKKIADGFTIYMAMSGHDLPLLVAVIPAKSPADFAAVDEKTAATLGDALRNLQGRALALTRRIEHKDSWYRPDMSYMPVAMK
jgi:hypothetical protein